jgi:hypothetical protein
VEVRQRVRWLVRFHVKTIVRIRAGKCNLNKGRERNKRK